MQSRFETKPLIEVVREGPEKQISNFHQAPLTQSLAGSEFVMDDHGRITDIVFHGKKASRSLKEVLPGPYRIHLIESSARYDTWLREVIISSDDCLKSTNGYVILAHEAAHATDYLILRTDQKLRRNLHASRTKLAMLDGFEPWVSKEDGQEYLDELQDSFNSKDMEGIYYPETDKTFIASVFEESLRYLGELSDEEKFDYKKGQEEREKELTARFFASKERNAWSLGIYAINYLHSQGIYLFMGTQSDLKNIAGAALEGYERFYQPYLTPEVRFALRDTPETLGPNS